MKRAVERRIAFCLFLLFTVAAYGACYFTVRKAIDHALTVLAAATEGKK